MPLDNHWKNSDWLWFWPTLKAQLLLKFLKQLRQSMTPAALQWLDSKTQCMALASKLHSWVNKGKNNDVKIIKNVKNVVYTLNTLYWNTHHSNGYLFISLNQSLQKNDSRFSEGIICKLKPFKRFWGLIQIAKVLELEFCGSFYLIYQKELIHKNHYLQIRHPRSCCC